MAQLVTETLIANQPSQVLPQARPPARSKAAAVDFAGADAI